MLSADETSDPSPSYKLLAATIVLFIVIVVGGYLMMRRGGSRGSGGGSRSSPCVSPKMPSLGSGLVCRPGGAGAVAWLTTTAPGIQGVQTPRGLTPLARRVATDGDCVTESACQGICLGDSACTYYSYDAGGQTGSKNCSATGAVCTTSTGGLPADLSTAPAAYVSGGIPASRLPPK
jgi:hypothetical protein